MTNNLICFPNTICSIKFTQLFEKTDLLKVFFLGGWGDGIIKITEGFVENIAKYTNTKSTSTRYEKIRKENHKTTCNA